MNSSIYNISIVNLVWALALALIVVVIYLRWSLGWKSVLYATARMVIQLIAVGFILVHLFQWESPLVMSGILFFMLAAAAWIASRPLERKRSKVLLLIFLSLAGGTLVTLFVVVVFVIQLSPWYQPRYLVPLAGMIFANAMNSVSLAADRFESENARQVPHEIARAHAFKTAMIPILNSFFAVGLVSLPGMMTGQILAGVSPLIAVRYQIVVMCMLLGGSGLSTAIFLSFLHRSQTRVNKHSQ